MGTPGIPKNSALAKSLAETLGTTVEALHRQFKYGDQGISFFNLKESDAYKNRVSKGRHIGPCENAYVVDNGDGKISKGDLFLHVDGLFQINCKYAFRFVKLGEKHSVQKSNGCEARKNPALTPEAQEILAAVTSAMGKPFTHSSFDIALKGVKWLHRGGVTFGVTIETRSRTRGVTIEAP